MLLSGRVVEQEQEACRRTIPRSFYIT